MRTYGRVTNPDGTKSWVEVSTDANGNNDAVYLTTLTQVIQLDRGESPFYSNYGIPARQSVVTQVYPDYYMMETQGQFSGYFASLSIARVANAQTPTYQVNVGLHNGAIVSQTIPI
jgi:hypothetical protein